MDIINIIRLQRAVRTLLRLNFSKTARRLIMLQHRDTALEGAENSSEEEIGMNDKALMRMVENDK